MKQCVGGGGGAIIAIKSKYVMQELTLILNSKFPKKNAYFHVDFSFRLNPLRFYFFMWLRCTAPPPPPPPYQ